MPRSKTSELRGLAERIANALPAVVEEVVLTGSVSRGVADEVSDIEMLVVTTTRLSLAECFEHAREVGLSDLDTWGVQGTETSRVFGYYEGVPIETTWWPHDFAEATVTALIAGRESAAAEALASGIPLRTIGLLESWQARLHVYPETLAAARIEESAHWPGAGSIRPDF
jgi:predicted nucleotidyltransferase